MCDGAASGGKCTGLVGLYAGLCAGVRVGVRVGMRVGMRVGHAPNCAANASGVFERNAFFCAKKICNNKPGGLRPDFLRIFRIGKNFLFVVRDWKSADLAPFVKRALYGIGGGFRRGRGSGGLTQECGRAGYVSGQQRRRFFWHLKISELFFNRRAVTLRVRLRRCAFRANAARTF